MGDIAYVTLKTRNDMEKHQINTIAPIPVGSKKGILYSKQDFIIDMNQKGCTCPAGQTTTKTRIKNGIISAFIFDKQLCNYCPHREQCTKHGKGKIITVHPEEKRRQEIIDKPDRNHYFSKQLCKFSHLLITLVKGIVKLDSIIRVS